MTRPIVFLLLSLFCITPAWASEGVVIGLLSKITSLDPRLVRTQAGTMFHRNTHERLFTDLDQNLMDRSSLKEALASRITVDDNQNYIIELKKGVMFHDGIELDADDVIFTMKSIKKEKSIAARFNAIKSIADVEKIDPYTIKVGKNTNNDRLLILLSRLPVMSKRARFSPGGSTEVDDDYYNPGTGAYKLVSSIGKDSYQFERFEQYHGEKPEIKSATIRYFKNAEERLAAFQSGDVNLIDKITPIDMKNLKEKGGFRFSVSTSTRLMLLFPDSGRKESPFIFDKKTNQPLESNPFQDPRVRQAVSYAVNRNFLAENTLGGAGEPAGQLLAKGTKHYINNIKTDDYLPNKAKKLLEEAGYPEGFKVTLHGTHDRYINDKLVLKAIGEMLTKVGIETTVISMDKKNFFPAASSQAFSLVLSGWAATSGTYALRNLIHSPEKEYGGYNMGGYKSSTIDELIQKIVKIRSKPIEQKRLIRLATQMVVAEKAIIPLYYEKAIWAMNENFSYNGNMNAYTFIKEVYLQE